MRRDAFTIAFLAAATAAPAACVPPLPAGDLAHPFDGGGPDSGKGGAAGSGADGAAPSGSFTLVANAGRPRNLAVDSNVYWVDRHTMTLMSIPESSVGSAPSPRAHVNSRDAWVAAHDGYVYWSDGPDGTPTRIFMLALGATQPTLIASGTDAISQIAVSSAG